MLRHILLQVTRVIFALYPHTLYGIRKVWNISRRNDLQHNLHERNEKELAMGHLQTIKNNFPIEQWEKFGIKDDNHQKISIFASIKSTL